ncbi:V-type proton ATPase 16 kDa proteolipid subunit [Diplonema papillatum]|nr:V-type proton ATPase 16 kDa proteolipid subunit [Diplonema papillatum]KAJ9447761.1 V-type proton ATPase 16 kDa proteolipid subunit [Diplonema papillatum]
MPTVPRLRDAASPLDPEADPAFAPTPVRSASRAGRAVGFVPRWNFTWKFAVVIVIVLYQAVTLFAVHPSGHERQSYFSTLFGSSRTESSEEDFLSAPVAPDYATDTPAVEFDLPSRHVKVDAGRGHSSTTGSSSGSGDEKRGGYIKAAQSYLGTTDDAGGSAEQETTAEVVAASGEKVKVEEKDKDTDKEKEKEKGPRGGRYAWVYRFVGRDDMTQDQWEAAIEYYNRCTPLAVLFGSLGATFGCGLSCIGAGIGIVFGGQSMAMLGRDRKSEVLRGMIPVVMAELLSIYGLITGVSISLSVGNNKHVYPLGAGFFHLLSGLTIGFSCLAGGFSLGKCGQAINKSMITNREVFSAGLLLYIFSEALALYGLIIGLLMNGTADAIIRSQSCVPSWR